MDSDIWIVAGLGRKGRNVWAGFPSLPCPGSANWLKLSVALESNELALSSEIHSQEKGAKDPEGENESEKNLSLEAGPPLKRVVPFGTGPGIGDRC
jgi:hypothetical protein